MLKMSFKHKLKIGKRKSVLETNVSNEDFADFNHYFISQSL